MSQWNWDFHPNTLAMREAMNQLRAEAERYAKQVAQLDALRHEAEQQRDELLAGMLNIANACRIWGGESERARTMLEQCIAKVKEQK